MERNVSSLAIVLHSQRYGQLNRRLKLLSVDFGIIDVVSYGARKSLKSVKAEVFSDGQFFLYYNPVKKDYAQDAQIATHDIEDLVSTYSALFFCELLLRTNGGESAGEYQLLSTALDLLSGLPLYTDRILIQFIHRLTDLLGLRTDLTSCPICERAYGPQEVISFSSSLSCPCCSRCASLESNMLLPPGARRYLVVPPPGV